jgi:phosphoribosylanthranilate isomerase
MLKIKIKASDITNLTDARYFAAKEVEWLCFNFSEGTASYIDPMKARAIFEWVEGPKIVGEFDNATADEINFYTEGWGLQAVQVGFLVPIETIRAIKNTPIIKDIWIEEFTNPDFLVKELTSIAPYVEAFQLNFDKNGITWADLKLPDAMITTGDVKDICQRFNIILSIDFPSDMLDEIVDLNLYGLTVKGGEEERIGVKSYDELDDILDAIVETEY